jgi:hypothetical protein
MDSLQDILGQKDFSPPDEVKALTDYVKRRYNATASVKLSRDALILSVPGSALAATLQLEKNKIEDALRLTKKLVIRTGRG